MPKRQNPFGDASPLQIKTHIGPKEVDMGVNKDKNMTNVYERTKSLLYEGAKKMSPVKTFSKDDQPVLRPLAGQCRLTFKTPNSESDCSGACAMEVGLERPSECVPSSSKPLPDVNGNSSEDLMTMDCDVTMDLTATLPKGQLQIDSSGQLHKAKAQHAQCSTLSTPYKLCNSCLRPSPLNMENCQFCDKRTCCNCIRECYSCHGFFCQVCSVINYDACIERPFCLQCST